MVARTATFNSNAGSLALGAVVGPLIFTLAWIVLGMVSPGFTAWGTHIAGYSWISEPISALGLGSTGPFMNAAFIVTGVLMAAGAVGIGASLLPHEARRRRLVTAVLIVPGLGAVIDGVFTFESFLPHTLGFALALFATFGFPIAGFVLRGKFRRLGIALIAAGPLTAALAVLYFVTFTPTVEGIQTGVAGLTERILVLELQAWYVVLGWIAFARGNPLKGDVWR